MAKGVRPMVGPSKILTVSYGTFSCTLEGFDDPFNTMKAIAEYFRDLAADDRYFGAEPPVPDAAMLHRIAEREIQRRVEARVQDGGVLLRAAEPAAEPAPPPAAHPRSAAAPAPRLKAPSPSIEESVAAKLARIRAAVDRARVAPPTAAEIEDAVEVAPVPAAADAVDVAAAPAEAPLAAPPGGVGPESAAAGCVVEDVMPPEAGPVAEAAAPAAEPPAADAPGIDDDAAVPVAEAGLSTARADERALSRHEIAAAAVDAADRAVVAEVAPAHAAVAPDDAGPDLGADTDAADLVTPPAPVPVAVSHAAGDPDLDALIGRITAAPAPAEQTPAASAEPAAVGDEAVQTIAEQAAPAAPEAAARPGREHAAPAATEGKAGRPAVVPVRARVIKVRRIEPVVPPAALLSPEDEDDLARELAAVEREIAGRPVAAKPAADSPVAPPAPEAPARPAPLPATGAEDAAVSRLIAQTNTAMDGAENRRRAATIAHLKAAVAATVADRAAGAAPSDAAKGREGPYRADLAEAVRPRRPEAVPGTGRRRPEAGKSIPPLVLVSELRVDRPAAAPAAPSVDSAPVRPRRVTAGSLALTRALDADFDADPDGAADDADGANGVAAPGRFAAAVARLGAGQLTDVIEAAAAYLTIVEGRATFTRPQLFRLAATVSDDAVSREDGLRAFGLLLREGRIVKARRGQFAVAEGNRMLAEMRKIAD
jgi:hypothetical protein